MNELVSLIEDDELARDITSRMLTAGVKVINEGE